MKYFPAQTWQAHSTEGEFLTEVLSESRRQRDNWVKANGSKEKEAIMQRSESARQVRTVGCWKGKGGKHKEKEMEQGRKETGN